MEIAERSKKKRFRLAMVSLTLALVSTVAMAVASLVPLYPLMLALIPFAAAGYYIMAFAFPAHSRAKIYLRIVKAVENDGLRGYSELSDALCIKEKYLRKCLTKCVGRRYLTRYGMGTDGLVEV